MVHLAEPHPRSVPISRQQSENPLAANLMRGISIRYMLWSAWTDSRVMFPPVPHTYIQYKSRSLSQPMRLAVRISTTIHTVHTYVTVNVQWSIQLSLFILQSLIWVSLLMINWLLFSFGSIETPSLASTLYSIQHTVLEDIQRPLSRPTSSQWKHEKKKKRKEKNEPCKLWGSTHDLIFFFFS